MDIYNNKQMNKVRKGEREREAEIKIERKEGSERDKQILSYRQMVDNRVQERVDQEYEIGKVRHL